MSNTIKTQCCLLFVLFLVAVFGSTAVYAEDRDRTYSRYSSGSDRYSRYYSDSDNDGVRDRYDDCPGTPRGTAVDSRGCPLAVDSDGDGVADNADQCPGFDDRIDVDGDGIADGCDSLIDSDGDGVADSADQCPGFDDRIDVDGDGIADGCDSLIDSDGDGVADSTDQCPGGNDLADADGDGIPDACDATPDPIVTEPVVQDPPPADPAPADPTATEPTGTEPVASGSGVDRCRSCHASYDNESPLPQLAEGNVDRHHMLNGTTMPLDSIAPFKTDEIDYECFSCHTITGGYTAVVIRDCLTCHGGNIGDGTFEGNPHHSGSIFEAAGGNCHRCHVSPGVELTGSDVCLTCHDGSRTRKNLVVSFSQPFAHPLDQVNFLADVSCLDCHNPTKVKPENRLNGASGVEPVWPGKWEEVTAFSETTVSDRYEGYQVCLKCHSSNNPNQLYDPYAKLGGDNALTDQAKEFNPNNASYHPVAAVGKNDFKMNGSRSSTDYSNALINGWTPESRMTCQDCHTSADGSDVGTHGSTEWPIATGPYSGPAKKTNVSNDLCFKCHNSATYGISGSQSSRTNTGYSGGGEGNLHVYHVGSKGARCTACHSQIPHGWKNKALLVQAVGSDPDPWPYNAQAGVSRPYGIRTSLDVNSVSSGGWSESYCHGGGGPGSGCDD